MDTTLWCVRILPEVVGIHALHHSVTFGQDNLGDIRTPHSLLGIYLVAGSVSGTSDPVSSRLL